MLTQTVACDLYDGGVVQQPVEQCGGNDAVAEHLEMPRRLTGESLRSGSLIRIIPCMASAFRSATDGRGGDRR
jgi:hypothetical protein